MKRDEVEVRKIVCLNCNKLLFESPSAVLVITCPRCGKNWRIEISRDGEIRYSALRYQEQVAVTGK